MSPKLVKYAAKIAVATASMVGIGAMYRAGKDLDEKIDAHYDEQKDKKNQS